MVKPLLNFQFQQVENSANQPTLVFMHGLFGDMNNLGVIARAFSDQYSILRLDLRNHGQSFHSQEMNYPLMAQDVLAVIQHLNLSKVILIGHSMGGKTAMQCASLFPQLIEKLVVIDIAPVPYSHHEHDSVFKGLFAVKQARPTSRQQAKPLLEQHISDPSVVQFMLKSFVADNEQYFRFNLKALKQNYDQIMNWQQVHSDLPTLFIKGGLSDYITPEYSSQILQQFPQAKSFTINGCGHWVHAQKPQFVVRTIQRFLGNNNLASAG